MKSILNLISIRAKDTLRKEGLISLARKGFTSLLLYFFRYQTCYVYEHTIGEMNEADFKPRIQDYTVQIISTKQQADELAAAGFEFRSHTIHASRKLDKGAIAFCIFVGRELAHIGWIAMTEEAKKAVDHHPYYVDFANNEACTGATQTMPQYRGRGLMTYGYYIRFQFLRERGVRISRNSVDTNNIASQKVHAKFGPKICVEARYLKILRWRFWKEKLFRLTSQHN